MTTESKTKTLTYHSKLVGVTFEGRQDVIATLRGKEPLRVRREKDNQYDPKAVAVDVYVRTEQQGQADNMDVYETTEWVPIGYIAKDKNSDIAASLDAGENVYIQMSGITGGDGKSYGVNISLEYKMAAEEVKVEKENVPSKGETLRVLQYLTTALGGKVDDAPAIKTQVYSSSLLGDSIEILEVNGHKRLDGYTSGSSFPERFYFPFDREGIIEGLVKKHNVSAEVVSEMWRINNEASTGYGTAVHAALENFDRNKVLGDKLKYIKEYKTKPNVIGPNKSLSRNPFLKYIVESFNEAFGDDSTVFVEEFIWDTEFKLCGSVDKIKVVDLDKKIIRIQDYKTDGDIHDKKYQNTDSPFKAKMGNELLDYHWLQLSFYAFILQRRGWTVEGLDIFWLNPNKLVSGEKPWEMFSSEVIDITEGLLHA